MANNTAQQHYRQGVEAERNGDLKGAETAYTAAIREEPEFREAHNNLGALLSRLGNSEGAIRSFQKALSLKEDATVLFNLGSESFKINQLDAAESYLKRALRLDKRMIRAHLLLAYLYGKKKELDKAVIYFKNALVIEKGNRMAALGLAVLYSDLGRSEEALAVAEGFLRLQPNDDAFVNLKAGLLLELNRTTDSLDEYRKLAQRSEKFKAFTSHVEAAKQEANEEYEKFFEDVSDKIKGKTEQIKRRILERRESGSKRVPETEQAEEAKDLVDLSLMHLFNGNPDAALKYLFEAKKRNPAKR